MKKELTIAAKFDTSDFDKSVESMQKKLKELYAPADLVRMQTQTAGKLQQAGMGGIMGQSPDAIQKSGMTAKRELDNFIREQAKGQETLTKLIVQRQDVLEKLKKKQEEMIKGSKEELDIKKQIAQVEENNYKMVEQYRQRDRVIGKALDIRQQGGGPPGAPPGALPRGSGSLPPPPPPSTGLLTYMGGAAGIATMVTGVLKIIQSGAEIYGNVARRPIDTTTAQGSAIAGTAGRELANTRTGQSVFDLAWLPEKNKAANMAKDSMKGQGFRDWASALGNVALRTLVGAAGGAVAGSAIPILGNVAGGIMGGIGGAASALTDKDTYNTLSFSQGATEAVKARRAKQFAENYSQGLQGLEESNPLKKMAVDEFRENSMRNLSLQRGMGIGDERLTGRSGLFQQGANAGFGSNLSADMMQNILGASGGGRAAQESTFALQAQRGMGMTNIGQIMGTLGGAIGGGKETKEATIKLLAEGVGLGLDQSKYAEENRRFVQAASEIVSKSGALGGQDVGRIAENLGAFVSERSNAGIGAAQSAYEKFQDLSSQTSGPRGVMMAAGIMKDKDLSKLSTIERQSFAGMKEQDINENNLAAVALADKLDITVEQLADKKKGLAQGAVSRFKEHDESIKTLKQAGFDPNSIKSLKDFKRLNPELQEAVRNVANIEQVENQFSGVKESRSYLSGQLGVKTPEDVKMDREAIVGGKLGAETGLAGDKAVAANAENTKLMLEAFSQFNKEIIPTAAGMAAFNKQLKETVEIISKMPLDAQGAIYKLLNTKPDNSTQNQSGKKSQ